MKTRLARLFNRPEVWSWVSYLWLLVFFFAPLVLILRISLSEPILSIPPYEGLATIDNNLHVVLRIYLDNYRTVFTDSLYFHAYLQALYTAIATTLTCLVLAYPLAYGIFLSSRFKTLLVMLVIFPFCTSFVIRVCSWMILLNPQGPLNLILKSLGLNPLNIMYTSGAVGVVMVYSYLPFMILPLYTALEKIDPSLLEAASDLGSRPLRTFFKIIFPLSRRGAVSGALLVFVPAIGEFVIPELVGGEQNLMIGTILWSTFFHERNWPLAATLALMMLVCLWVFITLIQKLQIKDSS